MNDHEARAQLQLIVSLASTGDVAAAAAAAGAIADKTLASEAWLVIGRANANMQRWNEARSAFENASRLAPESGNPRLELALLPELQGRHAETLALLQSLKNAGEDSPKLLVHLARALEFAGRADEARATLEAGVTRWSDDVPLHAQLAQLRWRQGAGTDFTAALERAVELHPRHLGLRLAAADLLRNAGESARAFEWLDPGRAIAPESPALLTSLGVLLEDLGRHQEAARLLRAAVQRAPQSVAARRNLVPAALRGGDAREALRLLEPLLQKSPEDQQLIAWRATALRIAGDAGYRDLHDYPRLVRPYMLRPPAGFGDLRAFNVALAKELTSLHLNSRRPLAQSLRGGSQTERNLPNDAAHPAIAAFFSALDEPIRDYIARLDPARDHPTDHRRGAGYRFAGSWSVQLSSGGFHTNHVHPQGWLSSAYYVELPAFSGGREREGWLQFGEPGMADPVCAPDHFVEPVPGMLVLFPSYLWHGTVPFAEGGRRLTAAFDVIPTN